MPITRVKSTFLQPFLGGNVTLTKKLEIERKFLLKYLPEEAKSKNFLRIWQYYHGADRYRETLDAAMGRVYHYNTKIEISPGVNDEEEREIDHDEFFAGKMKATKQISKDRYLKFVGGDSDLKWEIDDFLNIQLIVAEIELPALDKMPEMPKWLSDAVIMEVTGIKAFSNASLALPFE